MISRKNNTNYCTEVEEPTIEELRDNIKEYGAEYESVALSLKDYNHDQEG